MSTFAIVLLCFQACLIQNVFGICGDAFAYGPYNYAPAWAFEPFGAYAGYGYGFGYPGLFAAPFNGFAGPFAGPLPTNSAGAYGGAGVGDVEVAGELPSAGTTVVAGEVPILGAVEFSGPVCAAGTVTIAGTCGCGRSYLF